MHSTKDFYSSKSPHARQFLKLWCKPYTKEYSRYSQDNKMCNEYSKIVSTLLAKKTAYNDILIQNLNFVAELIFKTYFTPTYIKKKDKKRLQ